MIHSFARYLPLLLLLPALSVSPFTSAHKSVVVVPLSGGTALGNLELVTNSTTVTAVNANSLAVGSAPCGSGKVVIGGGCLASNYQFLLTGSTRFGLNEIWSCWYTNRTGSQNSVTIETTAYCVNVNQ